MVPAQRKKVGNHTQDINHKDTSNILYRNFSLPLSHLDENGGCPRPNLVSVEWPQTHRDSAFSLALGAVWPSASEVGWARTSASQREGTD